MSAHPPTAKPWDELIDRRRAAQILGLQAQTLAVWAMHGRHLPVIKVGRRVRYRMCDIAAYLERNTRPAT